MRLWNADGLVRIAYELARGSQVRLDVFDLRGRRVRQLMRGYQDGGSQQTVWDRNDDAGRSVASGVYFVRLDTELETSNGRVVVIR